MVWACIINHNELPLNFVIKELGERENSRRRKMMMMVMENEFQERSNLNINDIDLSLLRLSSPPPYDYSRSSFLSAASPDDISPLKRSSPVSDESDQPKRRRVSLQDPIFITSPLSSIDDPTRKSPVPEKQETSPFDSKSLETEVGLLYNQELWLF